VFEIRTRPGRPPLLVSRHRNPGRRRAPGAVRRLPDGFSRLGATWAAKSVAAVGVLAGAAVALALPVDASPAALTLAVPAATSSAARTADGQAASRDAQRAAVPGAESPAVSAPDGAAPFAPEQVGVAGVKAVAKPKPKPKPVAKSPSGGGTSAAAAPSAASYSTSVSGRCGNLGLISNAARLCSAVDSVYHLGSIGGYRANAGEHSTGQAVDFMISSRAQGDAIAAWVQGHVGEFDVKYVIWRQRYWEPGAAWDPMEDRGSPTANHMDHVHVTVNY
jgi:hypothetical protein